MDGFRLWRISVNWWELVFPGPGLNSALYAVKWVLMGPDRPESSDPEECGQGFLDGHQQWAHLLSYTHGPLWSCFLLWCSGGPAPAHTSCWCWFTVPQSYVTRLRAGWHGTAMRASPFLLKLWPFLVSGMSNHTGFLFWSLYSVLLSERWVPKEPAVKIVFTE